MGDRAPKALAQAMLIRSDRCRNLPRRYPPQRGGALSFLGGAQIDDSADTEPIHRTIIIGSQARQIFRAIQQSMADAVSVGRSVSADLTKVWRADQSDVRDRKSTRLNSSHSCASRM